MNERKSTEPLDSLSERDSGVSIKDYIKEENKKKLYIYIYIHTHSHTYTHKTIL